MVYQNLTIEENYYLYDLIHRFTKTIKNMKNEQLSGKQLGMKDALNEDIQDGSLMDLYNDSIRESTRNYRWYGDYYLGKAIIYSWLLSSGYN